MKTFHHFRALLLTSAITDSPSFLPAASAKNSAQPTCLAADVSKLPHVVLMSMGGTIASRGEPRLNLPTTAARACAGSTPTTGSTIYPSWPVSRALPPKTFVLPLTASLRDV